MLTRLVSIAIFIVGTAALLSSGALSASTFLIDNRVGSITVVSHPGHTFRVSSSSGAREVQDVDVQTVEESGQIRIDCVPADGATINIKVEVPYGATVAATTIGGGIALEGIFGAADLQTDTGAIRIATPWHRVELDLRTEQAVEAISVSSSMQFSQKKSRIRGPRRNPHWGSLKLGVILVRGRQPSRISIEDFTIPVDSWIVPTSHFVEAVDDMLASYHPGERRAVHFYVHGESGLASPDLQLDDLGIESRQSVIKPVQILAPSAPINIVFLLDLDVTMRRAREQVLELVAGVVRAKRPQDRIAIHALADDRFHVIQPLSQQGEAILASLKYAPAAYGSNRLTEGVQLSCARAFRRLENDRNMVFVVSDRVRIDYFSPQAAGGIPRRTETVLQSLGVMGHAVFTPSPPLAATTYRRRYPGLLKDLASSTGGSFIERNRGQTPLVDRIMDRISGLWTVVYEAPIPSAGEREKVRVRIDRPNLKVSHGRPAPWR